MKRWSKLIIEELDLSNTNGGKEYHQSEAEMYGWWQNWYESDPEMCSTEILKGTGTFTPVS